MKEKLSDERVACMIFCYQQRGMYYNAFIKGMAEGLPVLELSKVGGMHYSGNLAKLRPRLLKRMSEEAAVSLVKEVQNKTVHLSGGSKDPRNWIRELNKIYPDNELSTKIAGENRL